MNVFGDEHVSFTVLDMDVSPNGKFLLCATGMWLMLLNVQTKIALLSLRSVMEVCSSISGVADQVCAPLHSIQQENLEFCEVICYLRVPSGL